MFLKKFFIVVTVIVFVSHFNELHAQMPELPIIKPIPRSQLENDPEYKKFETWDYYYYEKNDNEIMKSLSGEKWYFDYVIYDKDGNPDEAFSTIEIFRNFKEAILEKKGTILYEFPRQSIKFYFPLDGGIKLWVYLEIVDTGHYHITALREKGF
jgi:hypothetical protein